MADRRGGGGGGGAEGVARQRQYDYRANSNLVLTAETRTREATEPSGEPETLWGKMQGKMGDRVQYGKPDELKPTKKTKRDSREETDFAEPRAKRAAGGGVLEMDAGGYRPQTQATRAAYTELLDLVQGRLGDYSTAIIAGAATEILIILKNENWKDPEKQREIAAMFESEVDSDEFFKMVTIGKQITDFTQAEEGNAGDILNGDTLDEETGVAVEFGEDDDDEDGTGDADEVVEDDDDDDAGVETARNVQTGGVDDADDTEDGDLLGAQAIDGHWLQRRITDTYSSAGTPIDAAVSQGLAKDVFGILEGPLGDREVENSLVVKLNFDKFELIKQLLKNRLKIVWCTKLERAESNEERARLEAEMQGAPDTAAILEALHATKATAKERQLEMERKIRQEARQLRGTAEAAAAGGDAGAAASGRHQVDFDSLAFNEGSHFMSKREVSLPDKTYRSSFKDYEEVHVPALKPLPFREGEKLQEIDSMPEWTKQAFRGMKSLNRIQSRVYETALFSAENMLICAPTGAGKTNCSMLTILHTMGEAMKSDGSVDTSKFKIVYIAPMKALVAEMVGNFSTRLEPYGMKVRELTGDMNLTKAEIDETQIIVTTPEKWDIITRKSGDRAYTQLVKLIIIDEIHLLHDDRGPVLESIVARTVRQVEDTQVHIRLVGLSATLPNFDDVATFLRVKHDKGLFYFDNSFRPCPLAQQYIGVNVKKPLQRFKIMNEICYDKVLAAAGKHQVLVFVHSRKETAKTARFIKEQALKDDKLARFQGESSSREVLQQEAEGSKNNDLKDLLPYGFAIHHAGMSRADRSQVEELFADKHISVLVSTATLAWGVNLPAHTVIIKGTQVYNPVQGAWGELSPLDVMQMFGRAGRPQFDSFGEGIIITGKTELRFYLSLFTAQLPIESQYVATIPDNLNAEIVLGTVTNLQEAATWLGYTYLYVRMLMNPELYGVPLAAKETDPKLLERRLDLAHSAATLLDKNNLIKYDRRSGTVQATDLGRIASHYYIKYTTLATFNDHLKPTMGDIELLRLFALSDEFKYIIVRDEEQNELKKLLGRVPIPIKETPEEPAAKINALLQAYISQLKLEGLAMASDMVYVTQSAGRLMRCLFEICSKRGWASLTDRALNLCKMINQHMWGSQTPLRQFKGIPTEVLSRIEKKDLAWERYYDLSAQELGELIRVPKLGRTLHRYVHQFPRLELAAQVQPVTRTVLKVDLTITPDFQWDDKIHNYVEPFWIWVEDSDGENLLHQEYFLLKKSFAEDDHTVTFTIPIQEPVPPQYFIKVTSDKWLSCETVLPVSFRHLLLPEKNPPPTELLDLQPLPISALRQPEFEKLYSFRVFNPIQTQVFNALYQGDENVLLAAPTGSGKTVCAELAMMRMIQKTEGRFSCVYIAPMPGLATERYEDWSKRFGGPVLGLKVAMLTGESAADVKLLGSAHIIISSPENWDMLSRKWKQRTSVRNVSLFILDELHLVGGRNGPVIEVITSRMRQISNSNKDDDKFKPIRIVGLAASLANAKDVADWLGVSAHGLFNFPPGVRPVPLEIHIHGIDLTNMEARMKAMARPAYAAVSNYVSSGKPAILFVPTRKHARLTALDLVEFAAADGLTNKFLQVAESDLTTYLAQVQDKTLLASLKFGVGVLHETMTATEKEIVIKLFEAGAIQVVVASAVMCWGMTISASLVVIMGTQYYDASGASGGADYSVTDLLQMMGRASRPDIDDAGMVVLMCHTPRKEYYKKFLFEPFPVESHLDHALHDHFVAEIVTRTIQNKQDAVDYLTWTFLFKRILQNPNYYNLQGRSHRHLSDHLSDLTESTLTDLENSKAIEIENDMDLGPLNLGIIASYYYISYTTMELFSSSLTARTKLKGFLDIITAASELDDLPMRPGEDDQVRKILTHAHLSVNNAKWTDPHTKANALLQAHFSRSNISPDLQADQRTVVPLATRLLQACVDVVASSGWLKPALAAMEMSQMVVQGLWDEDSSLLQLPHFTKDLALRCKDAEVTSVFELMDMKDEERRELLKMSEEQLKELARVCNRYPDIQLSFEIEGGAIVAADDDVFVKVTLDRDEGAELRPVDAPRYPGKKEEQWWLVAGDPKSNTLFTVRRFTLQRHQTIKLKITAPSKVGKHNLMLYYMSDSYMGCDQEYEFSLDVGEAKAGSSDEEAMEE